VTSQIRRLLNELAMSISGLEDVLNEAGRQYHVTDAELLRRQNFVATLKGHKDDLTSRFSRGADNTDPLKCALVLCCVNVWGRGHVCLVFGLKLGFFFLFFLVMATNQTSGFVAAGGRS
jgi:hypothetical protein